MRLDTIKNEQKSIKISRTNVPVSQQGRVHQRCLCPLSICQSSHPHVLHLMYLTPSYEESGCFHSCIPNKWVLCVRSVCTSMFVPQSCEFQEKFVQTCIVSVMSADCSGGSDLTMSPEERTPIRRSSTREQDSRSGGTCFLLAASDYTCPADGGLRKTGTSMCVNPCISVSFN